MRIGIISMQRLINFGSFLQAYGLKHILEDMGHGVEFIDVRLTNGTFLNAPVQPLTKNPVKDFARRFLKNKMYNLQVERQKKFLHIYFKQLGLPDQPNENTDYDAVVIGSDEVFSYCQFTQWGGTSMYFGVGVAASLVLSYAGSFGYTRLEDLQAIDMDKIIAGWLNNFHAISVRDINSFSIVQHLIGKEPSLNLDPVLIYNFDAAGLVPAINEKDYILIYGYDNRLTEEQYVAPIKAFAKKHNKKIISAGFFQDWCDKMVEVSPFELLAYVKQADYVICETFHGTVFSIKYQKQFAVVIRESNRNKLMDLMNRFSLGCRVFTGTEDLETILTASYDRNAVQKIIETERQNTKWYFESHLSGREFKE